MKKYQTSTHTDIGTKKSVNQDSLLLKQATSKKVGSICFACLCDGMGGLSSGEIASAAFVHRMDEWFKVELPMLFQRDDFTEQLEDEKKTENVYLRQTENAWNNIVQEMNERLKKYGVDNDIRLGTTVVVIMIIDDDYIAMNVGDSRAYMINDDGVGLITHDHSYIQEQIDLGRMTYEEAANSDKKSVLLQCIGASEEVVPSFYYGKCGKHDKYLLCSDGLWRKLEPQEIAEFVKKKNGLVAMTDMVKERGETDNISSLLIML